MWRISAAGRVTPCDDRPSAASSSVEKLTTAELAFGATDCSDYCRKRLSVPHPGLRMPTPSHQNENDRPCCTLMDARSGDGEPNATVPWSTSSLSVSSAIN